MKHAKHPSQRQHQRDLRCWLAVAACVVLLGVVLWAAKRPVDVGPGPSPAAVQVSDAPASEAAAGGTSASEGDSTGDEGAIAPEDDESTVVTEASATIEDADAPATTYAGPDRATLEPDTPAYEAFSPEADAAAEEAPADADLPRHEEETVLLSVPEGTTREEFEAMVEGLDFVSLERVTDSDLAMGMAVLTLQDGISVAEAYTRLEYVTGIEYAQPNYIYICADDYANPVAFAAALDDTRSLQAAAEIADVLTEELASAAEGDAGEGPVEPTDDAEATDAASADDTDGAASGDTDATTSDPQAADDAAASSDVLAAASVEATTTGDPTLLAQDLEAASNETNDPKLSKQWALSSINAFEAWAYLGYTTADDRNPIGIAIIDTGANVAHEDLQANVIADYYNSYTNSSDSSNSANVAAGNSHGTHVAGIVGAAVNNEVGIAGVSYNSRLLIIKASEGATKNFSSETVARAYEYLIKNASEYTIRVVNLSVAAYDKDSSSTKQDNQLIEQIEAAYTAGILTVCAAGNSDSGSGLSVPYASFPGDNTHVLSVINLTSSLSRSLSSNFNVDVSSIVKNISAPGTDIYSTYHFWNSAESSFNTQENYQYHSDSGTSMAAPCVAGVAALVFAVNPDLTPAQVMNILTETANSDVCSNYSKREYGAGEVDASAAVKAARAAITTSSGSDFVTVGDTESLQVMVNGETTSASSWNWTSSNTGVATIASDGTLKGVAVGEVTISATSKSGGMEAVSLTVYVTRSLSDIGLSGQTTVIAGLYYPFALTGTSLNDWTWTQVAGGGNITATIKAGTTTRDRLVMAKDVANASQGATLGNYHLRATSTRLGGPREWSITARKLAISQSSVTLSKGGNTTFSLDTTVALPSGATVTWSLSSGGSSYISLSTTSGTSTKVTVTNADSNTHSVILTATVTDGGGGKTTASRTITVAKTSSSSSSNSSSTSTTTTSTATTASSTTTSTATTASSTTTTATVAMYRMYNPNSGEHFYTASTAERASLVTAGWRYEGVGWYAPKSSSTPVYRLYSGTDHHYTMSATERDWLVSIGWKYEGVGWYSDDSRRVALLRVYNPNVDPSAPRNNSGSHHYTTSASERDWLVSLGWQDEGVGWYAVSAGS